MTSGQPVETPAPRDAPSIVMRLNALAMSGKPRRQPRYRPDHTDMERRGLATHSLVRCTRLNVNIQVVHPDPHSPT